MKLPVLVIEVTSQLSSIEPSLVHSEDLNLVLWQGHLFLFYFSESAVEGIFEESRILACQFPVDMEWKGLGSDVYGDNVPVKIAISRELYEVFSRNM